MKNSKAILLAIFASAFAVLTVVNMSLASPKSAGENTLDMLEIMTRAFDVSEGGEGGEPPANWHIGRQYWQGLPGWLGLNKAICCNEAHNSPCAESITNCEDYRDDEPPV
jgi:hypothetical protein